MFRHKYNVPLILAGAHALVRLFDTMVQVAASRVPVLFHGPPGQSKDLLARTIHTLSPRQDKTLAVIDCRKVSAQRLDDILFGTPAENPALTSLPSALAPGQLRLARGGTVLLQQIQALPAPIQARLHEVLHDNVIDIPGQTAPAPVDFRLIATSDHDLQEETRNGRFRQDLFTRLSVFSLHVPTVLARREEIVSILDFFLDLMHIEDHAPPGSKAQRWLTQLHHKHEWPQDLRELQTALRRAFSISPPEAEWDDLLPLVIQSFRVVNNQILPREDIEQIRRVAEESLKQYELFGGDLYASLIRPLERELIQIVMQRSQGIKTKAAATLGMSLLVLNRKLRELGLETVRLTEANAPA